MFNSRNKFNIFIQNSWKGPQEGPKHEIHFLIPVLFHRALDIHPTIYYKIHIVQSIPTQPIDIDIMGDSNE